MGASTEPWETPEFTGNGWEKTPLTRMEVVRLLRKLDAHNKTDGESPNVDSPPRRPCQTRLKALEMSSKTRCVSPWLSTEADQECKMRASRSPVERRDRIGGRSVVLRVQEMNVVGRR